MFLPAMSKLEGRLDPLTSVLQPFLEKENFELNPAILWLNIDLVSFLTYGGGVE